MVPRAVCISLVALAFVGIASACDSGWHSWDDKCFFVSDDKQEWAIALQKCSSLSGHLAEVHSQYEHELLTNWTRSVADAKTGGFWIGLTDNLVEGTWIWTTSQTQLNADSYAIWGHNQPDNGKHHQNCVFLNSHSGHWFDGPCSGLKYFLCEKANGEVITG